MEAPAKMCIRKAHIAAVSDPHPGLQGRALADAPCPEPVPGVGQRASVVAVWSHPRRKARALSGTALKGCFH